MGRATYKDLVDLPEHLVGEILDGELVVSPRPRPAHAVTSSELGGFSSGFHGPPGDGRAGGPGGWWILDEPELHLGADVLVPDLAGWRRERMPRIPDEAFFTLAPDWVCEVASPSTERIDRSKKMRIYAREKISYLWIVNPMTQTVETYALDADAWRLLETFAGDGSVRAVPLDALPLELRRLCADRI